MRARVIVGVIGFIIKGNKSCVNLKRVVWGDRVDPYYDTRACHSRGRGNGVGMMTPTMTRARVIVGVGGWGRGDRGDRGDRGG